MYLLASKHTASVRMWGSIFFLQTGNQTYKVRLRACMILEFRDWHRAMMERSEHVEGWQRPGLSVRVHTVRSDGTQAQMFKKSKLQVCEVL